MVDLVQDVKQRQLRAETTGSEIYIDRGFLFLPQSVCVYLCVFWMNSNSLLFTYLSFFSRYFFRTCGTNNRRYTTTFLPSKNVPM